MAQVMSPPTVQAEQSPPPQYGQTSGYALPQQSHTPSREYRPGAVQPSVPAQADVNATLQRLDRLVWVADRTRDDALKRGSLAVAEHANDIADTAALERTLLARRSPFTATFARSLELTIERRLRPLEASVAEPGVEETITESRLTLDWLRRLFPRTERPPSVPEPRRKGKLGKGTVYQISFPLETDYAGQGLSPIPTNPTAQPLPVADG